MGSVNYRDLLVWQRAMEAVKEIYVVLRLLPIEEKYGLSDQLRRSAVSIPSNIAEGQDRGSDKEFVRFLHIANGSRAESETQLLLCVSLGYCTEEHIRCAMELLNEVSKMLASLIRSIAKN